MTSTQMRSIYAFLLILTLWPGVILRAEKVAVIKDAFKWPSVIVDNTHFCIIAYETSKIFVYSLKDGKKISQFGSRGLGPGEFIGMETVNMAGNKIYVSSFPKLCIYSKEGQLLKEMKGNYNFGTFIPLGDSFSGASYPPTPPQSVMCTIEYSLLDSSLKPKKNLMRGEIAAYARWGGKKEIILWVRERIAATSYKNQLFICNTHKGFHISVFDQDGNRLYEINRPYEKRKVTKTIQKEMLEKTRKELGEKEWKIRSMQYDYVFAEYFPAFENFTVADDKIYVFNSPVGKNRDVQILDLKGNLIKRKTVPDLIDLGIAWREGPKIVNGKFYYMVENEDAEVWELHSLSLD